MFSWQDPDPGAPPAPVLLDFALPDALRRARHAALLPLKPILAARGWSEPKFLLLRALAEAGEPLTQTEAAARAGLNFYSLRPHVRRLIDDGYIEWVPPPRRQYPYIVARDIGRRQVNHIVRALVRGEVRNGAREGSARGEIARTWADLAALPAEVRVSEPMRAQLFASLDRLTRACAGEDADRHANAPAGWCEPNETVAVSLPLPVRRARAALVARIGAALRHYDLSEAQWRILRILDEQPGVGWTRRGLERRGCFHFSDPAVHRTLIYLNERGLVRRHAEGERPAAWRIARRQPAKRWRVEIARAGRDMVARIEGREAKVCADFIARLEAREMAILDRLLRRATLALLWRKGFAPEDQEVHPLGGHYERFDAEVFDAAREFEFRAKILREAGLPVPTRAVRNWWE